MTSSLHIWKDTSNTWHFYFLSKSSINPASLGFKEIFYFAKYFFIDASSYGLTETNYVDMEGLADFHYNNESLQTIHRTMVWYPVYSSSYAANPSSSAGTFICTGTSPIQSSIDLIVSYITLSIKKNLKLIKFVY